MAKLQFSLLAAVLFVVGAQASVKSKCSWALGKHPFDEEKMVGTWYVISFASNNPEKVSKSCGKYEINYFKSNDDVRFDVGYSAMDKDKKLLSYEGVSRPYKKDRRSMFLGSAKKTGGEQYNGVFKEAIIATDYDNYAIYLGCKPTFDPVSKDFGRRYDAAVVSRQPTLNEDIKNTLINVLSGYDIDPSEFKTMDQTGCPQ